MITIADENGVNELGQSILEKKELQNEIVFWTCDEDAELLSHESMDEAIEEKLDEYEEISDFPETIEVFGFVRKKVKKEILKKVILEAAFEYLAENHDGEDGHEVNEEIENACENFVNTYIENFTSWQCELSQTIEVNVKEWTIAQGFPEVLK